MNFVNIENKNDHFPEEIYAGIKTPDHECPEKYFKIEQLLSELETLELKQQALKNLGITRIVQSLNETDLLLIEDLNKEIQRASLAELLLRTLINNSFGEHSTIYENIIKVIRGVSNNTDSSQDPFKQLGNFTTYDSLKSKLDTLIYDNLVIGANCGFFRAKLNLREIEIKNIPLHTNNLMLVISGMFTVKNGNLITSDLSYTIAFRCHDGTSWSEWTDITNSEHLISLSNVVEEEKQRTRLVENQLFEKIQTEELRALLEEKKLEDVALTQGTVRFDRIVEEKITINAGPSTSIREVVYSKHYNKFVAFDGSSYWDTWLGVEAYMDGNKIRKDKVYLCGNKAYSWQSYFNRDNILQYTLREVNETPSPIFLDGYLRFKDVVKELWLNPQYLLEEECDYRFKIHKGYLYFRVYPKGSTSYMWNCKVALPAENSGEYICELVVTNKSQTSVKLGETVGYVVLNKIIDSTDSSTGDIINIEYITVLSNFPIISEYVHRKNLENVNQEIFNHQNTIVYDLNDLRNKSVDLESSVAVDQFLNGSEVGKQMHSSSTFSGVGMFVGELKPFRYILSYAKCANWVNSPTSVSSILLQIRQDNKSGVLLYSKTLPIIINPGEVKAVLFDLEEVKTFSGNLFVALRADSWCTFMQPKNSNYPYEPADGSIYPNFIYWTNGDINNNKTGSASSATSGRNFYFQTFAELKNKSTLTDRVVDDLRDRLNLNEYIKVDSGIEISLPDKIYAVVGDTLQLFYRGMIKAVNPYNYDILVSCSKGKQTPRYFHYKPKADDVGVIDFTLSVRDNSAKTIASKTCKLHIVAAPKSPATKTNILCFGASNVAGGEWVKEVNRRLTKTGGTPAGNGLSNIEFCGSKKGDGAGWFGVGGWNWASYISAGNPAFRFYVTGVESLSIGAVYTHNGYSYTIAEVNVTEGAGNILCKTSSKDNVPTVSGILTKSSGDGDNTITFEEYVVDAQNPLWDAVNNKMSFIPYANEVSDGQIDVVYTYLTWNGLSPNMEIGDFSTILSQAKKFADTLHAEFPNAKLKMMAQNPPSVQGGMGANYGANGNNYSDAYGMFLSIMVMNDAYQEFANSEGYSDFVEFVNVSSQFDVENNMQSAEYAVNTRNSKTELRDTNGVHPALEGYYQVADVVYRNFVANFCQ